MIPALRKFDDTVECIAYCEGLKWVPEQQSVCYEVCESLVNKKHIVRYLLGYYSNHLEN